MATLFLTSKLLDDAGVVHGFSLREGGVSQGPFQSLNLSRSVGDGAAFVEENLQRLARAAGLESEHWFATAKQVHSDRVLLAQNDPSDPRLEEIYPPSEPAAAKVSGEQAPSATSGELEGDAVVSRTPGIAAAVRIADCTPILIWSPDAHTAAAVHSGWRGAKLAIAGSGVRALESYGAVQSELIAAVGPCIGRCCYAVSPELAHDFRAQFGPEVADDPETNPAPHLDLRACAAIALMRAGVSAHRIDQVEGCTSCSPELFFSHRRDKGQTGRHLAFISP